jgi:phospholipase C
MLRGTEAVIARRRVRRREGEFAAERPNVSLERGADTLPDIHHIVILMMENHSYDNYFGMMSGRGDGFPLDSSGAPTLANSAEDGTVVPLKHVAGTGQEDGVPTQTWSASHIQFNGGACNGFVRSVEETLPGKDRSVPMGYWDEADLPFYYGLARTFPLATRWFSSCLGPTFPNRRFLIAGTANGLIDDLVFGMTDYPKAGTIFDLLTAHGISWINYHHVPPVRINIKRILGARGVNFFRRLAALFAGLFPQVRNTLESKIQVTADMYPLGFLRSINHLRIMDKFWDDAANGTLPAVSIVDPDFGQWSEENPQDIQAGEGFSAKVINAIMHGKGWPQTLLIWLYDEHGGYFDHVAPPKAPAPDDVPGQSPMDRFLLLRWLRWTTWGKQIDLIDSGPSSYDNLGFRVPAVIVSPFVRPDFVTDQPYDHTSILKLIERKWNLPALTKRDASAADPLGALDFNSPPTFSVPPILPDPARPWPSH